MRRLHRQHLRRRLAVSVKLQAVPLKGCSGISGFEILADVLATRLTGDLKFDTGRADSRKLDIDLEEMGEDVSASMRKARAGFALVIEEMQDLEADLLGALLSVQHVAG